MCVAAYIDATESMTLYRRQCSHVFYGAHPSLMSDEDDPDKDTPDGLSQSFELPKLEFKIDSHRRKRLRLRLLDKLFGDPTSDRYERLERIGEGGMGVVYAAFDTKLGRKVALKKVHNPFRSGLKQRLRAEAQALARLNHPNIVQVHDFDKHEGEPCIVMEYVDGRTLDVWLGERTRTVSEIIDVFDAAGRGLLAAHAQGFIHRDFKPRNVMVDSRGRARVMDFGLACLDPEELETNHSDMPHERTQRGLSGTPAYMAPEQFRGDWVDEKCDQFSFCVALYEALYGERPFWGQSFEQLRSAVEQGHVRPPPPGARVSPKLREVLVQGLSCEAADRFADMDALLSALAEATTDNSPLALHVVRGHECSAGVIIPSDARDDFGYFSLFSCQIDSARRRQDYLIRLRVCFSRVRIPVRSFTGVTVTELSYGCTGAYFEYLAPNGKFDEFSSVPSAAKERVSDSHVRWIYKTAKLTEGEVSVSATHIRESSKEVCVEVAAWAKNLCIFDANNNMVEGLAEVALRIKMWKSLRDRGIQPDIGPVRVRLHEMDRMRPKHA